MTIRANRRLIALISVPTILIVGAGTALAAPTSTTGTTQSYFAAATEDMANTYTGNAWQTVADLEVDSGGGEHIVARFTAESACYGGNGWCAARILVDGQEADPASGRDFAFDTTDGNKATKSYTESHTLERVITNLSMGNKAKVEVQVAMVGSKVEQRLDDWTLTAFSIAP